MNHDGNRLLIGLTTAAIAAAVVATLYVRSTSSGAAAPESNASTGRIALAGYRPEGAPPTPTALQKRVRDYQSEVTAAIARGNPNPTAVPADDEDEADLFDTDLVDDAASNPANVPPPAEIPNPTDFSTGNNPNPSAYTTEGPVADNAPDRGAAIPQTPPATNANAGDEYGQSGTMSDTDVYRLVVNNLSDDQRRDFTRAYAAMSAEQRADLLDGFRQQIQGGN